VSSNLMARDYKDARDLVQEEKEKKYVLRRLTPVECCRLQGFPDWWEDGAEGSDSARYKMWGNGIALPCAVDVLFRISKEA
jgi:DNA (cytosine-5)-methyltransferase 1